MKKLRKRRFVIDLAGVRSAARLHAVLAEMLPLPEGYGRNLDALYDILTEFGPNWRIVFRNASASLKGFRAVCEDAVTATPGLEIEFEG
ncbi:MAG: barstar family protein [Kiritimatiellae bacterium]|nr:barstar family protein [Kiritimatiellia bacterium]